MVVHSRSLKRIRRLARSFRRRRVVAAALAAGHVEEGQQNETIITNSLNLIMFHGDCRCLL